MFAFAAVRRCAMSMLVVRMRMWMDVGVKGVRMLLVLLLLSVAAIVVAD